METQQAWVCVHKHNNCSRKVWPKHKKIAIITTMQKSWGSLQVCIGGFGVCKTYQTYITMFHTLLSNHAPKKWYREDGIERGWNWTVTMKRHLSVDGKNYKNFIVLLLLCCTKKNEYYSNLVPVGKNVREGLFGDWCFVQPFKITLLYRCTRNNVHTNMRLHENNKIHTKTSHHSLAHKKKHNINKIPDRILDGHNQS